VAGGCQKGEVEAKSLGRHVTTESIYLWARMSDMAPGNSSGDRLLSLNDTVVSQDNPTPLITQAVAIRKAYKSGFNNRSKEVQSVLSGLLGVDLNELASED